jgi:pimeloyl-ACP methyl ester carboxylesterase
MVGGAIAVLVLCVNPSGHAAVEAPRAAEPVISTILPVAHSRGLMVTSGGWGYCEQVRSLARRTRYTLLCGRYYKDGYLGPQLRSKRHLDWGNPRYLARFAETIRATHRRVGGELLLIGVSYSGFGVATLASHHPEIRPDRVVVIDSYLDLVARRRQLPSSHETAQEIDEETAGSETALRNRSAGVEGLARLIRGGTRLTVIWSVSEDERRLFRGATCNREASAATLARLASTLGRPIPAWVTQSRHGHDLWNRGVDIVRGHNPGRRLTFTPSGRIPEGATCADVG